MAADLPSHLKVGARRYQIQLDAQRCEDSDALGLFLSRVSQILLHPVQDTQSLRVSLLHESFHALIQDVDEGNGWLDHEAEERIVAHLAPRMLDLLRRNPELLDFLTAKD